MEWRASFAVKLYDAMASPHFPAFLRAVFETHLSSLRLLQMRFWKDDDLPTFTRILQFVSHHRISKHVIEGAIQGWTVSKQPASLSLRSPHTVASSSVVIVSEFAQRIETYMNTKQTQKRLRAAEAVLSPGEIQVLKQLQHLPMSIEAEHSSNTATPSLVFSVLSQQAPAAAAAAAAAPTPSATAVDTMSMMQISPDFPPPVVVNRSLSLRDRSTTMLARVEATMEEHDADMVDVIERPRDRQPPPSSHASPALPTPRQSASVSHRTESATRHRRIRSEQGEQAPTLITAATAASSRTSNVPKTEQPSAKRARINPSPRLAVSTAGKAAVSAAAAAAAASSSTPVLSSSSSLTSSSLSSPTVPNAAASSSSRDHTKLVSPAAILPLAFALPLSDALPFEPVVAAHLKEYGVAVVEPSFREHTAWLKELDEDLLQHASFRHAYRMTLGCVNDGSGFGVSNPKPSLSPQQPNGLYPSPPLSAEEVFAFLEKQWAHMTQVSSGKARVGVAPQPPASTIDCVYLKDLSAESHHLRRPQRGHSNGSDARSFFPKWDQQLQKQHETHEVQVRSDALIAAASQAASQVSSAIREDRDGDIEMTQPAVDEIPSRSIAAASVQYPALYMDAYADHPSSLLRLTEDRCDGVHNAYAYLKYGFQFFNLHVEQWLLPFVHHQVSGESTWILIPHSERHKLRGVVQKMARVRREVTSNERGHKVASASISSLATIAPVLLYSKSLLPPLSLLHAYGIQFHRLQLRAGQVLVAHGGFAHYGFSTGAGETHAFACNIMSEEWLISGGPEFVIQFFEWVLDLSDLSPQEIVDELTACGLQEHHLANALNTCPPAYSCTLLRALRDDLQRYQGSIREGSSGGGGGEYEGPPARGHYTLTIQQSQKALATLDTALDVLHHSDVRAFLQRVFVDAEDDQTQICTCQALVTTTPASPLPERSLRRFYAAMEREHALVVGSGAGGSKPNDQAQQQRRVGRAAALPAAAAAAAAAAASTEAVEQKETPISQTFGSVTFAPMSRLLNFLSGDAVESSLRLTQRSRFLDVGSGIGQVVLHAQLRFGLASSTGIEYVWDRSDAALKTLASLRDAAAAAATTANAAAAAASSSSSSSSSSRSYDLESLRPALQEDRLQRVVFLQGRIEDRLDLIAASSHVFMFDAAFHSHTHRILLPRLCDGHSRIVVTCLSLTRMRGVWPNDEEEALGWDAPPSSDELGRMFRLLTQMPLTLAGSNTTRMVYVYATHPRC